MSSLRAALTGTCVAELRDEPLLRVEVLAQPVAVVEVKVAAAVWGEDLQLHKSPEAKALRQRGRAGEPPREGGEELAGGGGDVKVDP